MGRFRHDRYVEVTMHFRCNLACEHCMILKTMHRLEPESPARFQEILEHNRRHRQWTGLTLTGAEVTLRRDLPDLARAARQHGFDHVRIQTHGMRLADERYCRELVEAGVDEFFVSLTAPDAAGHDAITGVPGSFDRTLLGLENLEGFAGVVSLTNTVITRNTYRHLPGIVERVGRLRRLVQMDFWAYWPMCETDELGLIVPHPDAVPYLRQALAMARERGRAVEVKNFPECLLGGDRDALNNDQPKLFIDPSFWPEFMRNGFEQCVHRPVCGSRQCLGLTTAYVQKYGWEADRLTPLPGPSPRTPASPPDSTLDG